MKFLHLSDLHIGKVVNGFSMLEEQRHAFSQVLDYVRAERVDAVVIAGDVYDRNVPGADAVSAFDDFLTWLANEGVAVLLVAGNHDSAERLAYARRLLEDKRLFLCGAFTGEINSVVLTDKHGDVRFWMLPFIQPATVRGFYDDREIENYDAMMAAVLERANVNAEDRNVLIAHQFFVASGTEAERSDSERNSVGGLDAVGAQPLSAFDYVALGHLHRSQQVGCDHVRYAGSPVKYSFSEWKHEKSVTLVELQEKGDVTTTLLPLTPLRDMRQIEGEIDVLTSDEIASQGNRADYLRVILTDEDEVIEPMAKLRSVYPNVMECDLKNSRTSRSVDVGALENVETLSPHELFSEFFLEVNGAVMSDEQARIVREIFAEMEAV